MSSLTLYRVGPPTVGETWPARFRASRSTGGLGAGAYAFRDEEAAKRNEDEDWTNDGLFVLKDSLNSPIQPSTRDATDDLVRFSRGLALLAQQVHNGEYTFAEAKDEGADLRFTLGGGLNSNPAVGVGSTAFSRLALNVILNTPELRDKYGLDNEQMVVDAINAAESAYKAVNSQSTGSFWMVQGTQPINRLLYPDFDGVAPRDGAGGNTGYHGCVILKERVDACVGRNTDNFEEVDPSNPCWS